MFIFLTFTCGAGAIFVDKREEMIKAQTASMGLDITEPVFSSFPKEISKDSEIYITVKVKNTSTVPVYVHDCIDYTVNGKTITMKNVNKNGDEIKSDLTDPSTSNVCVCNKDGSNTYLGSDVVIAREIKQVVQRLNVGEIKELTYKLVFPGADNLPEGNINIKGNIIYSASTSKDESYGFKYGPQCVNINLSDGQLSIPVRSKDIMLNAIIEEGSHNYGSVKWYRSDGEYIKPCTLMEWKPARVDKAVTIFNLKPVYFRYEIYAKGGIVRSPVFKIVLNQGDIKMQSYDYFDGDKVNALLEKT